MSISLKRTLRCAPPLHVRRVLDMNLLPRDRRPADVSLAAVAAIAVLFVCVAAIVPFAFKVYDARRNVSIAETQADDAQRAVNALQVNLTRQRGATVELEAAKAKLAALETERAGLQGGRRPLHDDLAMLVGVSAALPSGVRLTAITGADGSFKVDGIAPGPLDAITYAEALMKLGGFTATHLASFAPAPKDGGQFTIEVMR